MPLIPQVLASLWKGQSRLRNSLVAFINRLDLVSSCDKIIPVIGRDVVMKIRMLMFTALLLMSSFSHANAEAKHFYNGQMLLEACESDSDKEGWDGFRVQVQSLGRDDW